MKKIICTLTLCAAKVNQDKEGLLLIIAGFSENRFRKGIALRRVEGEKFCEVLPNYNLFYMEAALRPRGPLLCDSHGLAAIAPCTPPIEELAIQPGGSLLFDRK